MKAIKNFLQTKTFLYICLGLMAYFLFNIYQENETLEASKEVWEEKAKERDQEIINLYDSLETANEKSRGIIKARYEKISDILTSIDELENSENEKAIDHITDADSISKLFARYYPDHSASGQGSDQD